MANRFSIYRDASGYLNYRVIDANGNNFIVSADVSSWKSGEQHHVAASWNLATPERKDEMHLFIDGQEVQNILRYGSKVSPLSHQKFRTISTEEIVGQTPKSIVGSYDLTTGGTTVSSSINFTDLGISVGDIIYINEQGFSSEGYVITNVNGDTLSLSTSLPAATSCLFSINKTSFPISDSISLYKNIAVSKLELLITDSNLQTTINSTIVTAIGWEFASYGVMTGNLLKISATGFDAFYTIVSVSGNTLTLSSSMPSTNSGLVFFLYTNNEIELNGKNALHSDYSISNDGYFGNLLTITNGVSIDDIILVRTLGLNHSRVKNRYYVWGNSSNIINTRLPTPISLADVQIYHTLLSSTTISSSNSTLSGSIRTSNNLLIDQPSVSDTGRTLSITIGGDNIDYSTAIQVQIQGSSSETISFSSAGTKTSINKYTNINYITVTVKPVNTARSSAVIKVSEFKPITTAESSLTVPVIRYSYQMMVSNQLTANGTNIVSDSSVQFSSDNIGNYLIIYSPSPAVGQYLIRAVSSDLHSITVDSNIPSFSGGNYEILNVLTENSGLQNGRFVFEQAPGVPYPLSQGYYELDYHTNLSIPITPNNLKGFLGSDLHGNRQSKAIIDDFQISDIQLSDVRNGDISQPGTDSITAHYNSLKSLTPTVNSLILLDFDGYISNKADTYLTSSKQYLQSSTSVNDNFGKSIIFTDTPLLVDNSGILDTRKEGTIEFWINPLQDTGNDPNYRFYFDASAIVSEKISSINNATVRVTGRVSEIVSIKLQRGDYNFDYFAGGSIDPDGQTIYLNNKLPGQNTPIVVNYIPTGINGNRLSIYKDPSGYINFNIVSNGLSQQIRAPIYWTQGSWHKVRAQYRFNQGLGKDQIRLFIDGKERGNILFGNGLLFGQHLVFGSTFVGSNSYPRSISFTDTINEFFIGSDYTGVFGAYAAIDNLRISNIFRPILLAFNESIDPGYSNNIQSVFPATSDLYTTYLLDFESLTQKNTDFAVIKNKNTGLSDITINVYDSYGILESNEKSKTVMEALLDTLTPASSQVFIKYK